MDKKTLLKIALKKALEAILPDATHIIGWEAAQHNTYVISIVIDAGDEKNTLHNARLESHVGTDESTSGNAILDYASVTVPITINIYIHSKNLGKTLRANTLQTILTAFAPTKPGQAPGLWLPLLDTEGTQARIDIDSHNNIDTADAIPQNRYRALLKLTAVYREKTTVNLPQCNEIQLGTDSDTRPVDDINPTT